jgi:DNA-directed RNA polymerase specialized sigma24 family protein
MMRKEPRGSRIPGGGVGSAEFARLTDAHLDLAWRVASHLTCSPSEAVELVEQSVAQAIDRRSTLASANGFKLWFLAILKDVWEESLPSRADPADGQEECPPGALFARVRDVGLAGLPNASAAILDRVDASDLGRALARLPLECRAITTIALSDDLGYGDIGRVMQLPTAAVRGCLHRGRAHLKLALWEAAVDRGLLVPAR